MFKILTVLCVALIAVNAYDFSDTYFNQYLFEEYESLNENTVSRHRRDVDKMSAPVEEVMNTAHEVEVTEEPKAVETPNVAAEEPKVADVMDMMDDKPGHCGGRFGEMMKKDLTCCEANKHDPSYFSMIRETKKQCAMKLRANNADVENFDPFNCSHMDKIKELIICESECVAKTLNMIDENGDISRDVIVASFNKKMASDSQVQHEVLEGYVDKCLAKLKDMSDLKPENKCSRAPMELQHCLFGEMVIGCPAESQVNSPRCQKIRERYTKGQTLSFGKHILHEFLHHGRPGGRHGGHGAKDQM